MLDNRKMAVFIRKLKVALKDLPDPSVTLVGKKWKSPFLVLISCVMSLRTKDETTLPASERLFALATTPAEMIKLTPRQIEKAIYPCGFYKTKARNILKISQIILDDFNGQVPDNIDDLLTLPNVGRKTANLTITEGYGKLGICVDTHVHRISNRLGYVQTKDPDKTEFALRDKLAKKYWVEYNMLLVMWGQNVCKPISPLCSQCPVNKICEQVDVDIKR